jgi:hypothetical protein
MMFEQGSLDCFPTLVGRSLQLGVDPHPIQDRADDELKRLADDHLTRC